MKKWLCTEKCIYAKQTIVETNRPLWAMSLRAYKVKSLAIHCSKQDKGIHKFITQCEDYQNTNLFTLPKKPQYLEKNISFNCKVCNGKGFVIVKILNVVQRMNKENPTIRFIKEKCEVCNGRGIIVNDTFRKVCKKEEKETAE